MVPRREGGACLHFGGGGGGIVKLVHRHISIMANAVQCGWQGIFRLATWSDDAILNLGIMEITWSEYFYR